MSPWLWFLAGLFIGALLGFVVAAMCHAAHEADAHLDGDLEYQFNEWKRNELRGGSPSDGSPRSAEPPARKIEPPRRWRT